MLLNPGNFDGRARLEAPHGRRREHRGRPHHRGEPLQGHPDLDLPGWDPKAEEH